MREWLPEGHLAWFVLEVLERVDTTVLQHSRRPGGNNSRDTPNLVGHILSPASGWDHREVSSARSLGPPFHRIRDPETGRARDCQALIFTPVVSRYSIVWLTHRQTIDDVIARRVRGGVGVLRRCL